jgi:glycosyltransferase involved in cell wall biosynthesis
MTVCLVMIVKNEEHVIERSLQSALSCVDTWCIVDTGSTDATMDIIRRVTSSYGKEGKEGKLYERPWVNFGHNRSEALQLARPLADWSCMMDADDILHFPEGPLVLDPAYKGYTVRIQISSINTYRTHIFNNAYPWCYVGSLHEYPDIPGEATTTKALPATYWMDGRCEGARSKNPTKFEDDARLLEEELLTCQKESKPMNPRSIFYAAQSWRDAGKRDKAIEWYKKRVVSGGWPQEIYVSLQNLVNLSPSLDDKFKYAWLSLDVVPGRLEAIHALLRCLREHSYWSTQGYTIGMTAAATAATVDVGEGTLFLEPDVYAYQFDDEMGIQAYYTNHKEVCARHSFKALQKAPAHHIERLKANYEFSIKPA